MTDLFSADDLKRLAEGREERVRKLVAAMRAAQEDYAEPDAAAWQGWPLCAATCLTVIVLSIAFSTFIGAWAVQALVDGWLGVSLVLGLLCLTSLVIVIPLWCSLMEEYRARLAHSRRLLQESRSGAFPG